jgi:hypothetical protein
MTQPWQWIRLPWRLAHSAVVDWPNPEASRGCPGTFVGTIAQREDRVVRWLDSVSVRTHVNGLATADRFSRRTPWEPAVPFQSSRLAVFGGRGMSFNICCGYVSVLLISGLSDLFTFVRFMPAFIIFFCSFDVFFCSFAIFLFSFFIFFGELRFLFLLVHFMQSSNSTCNIFDLASPITK